MIPHWDCSEFIIQMRKGWDGKVNNAEQQIKQPKNPHLCFLWVW